MNIVVDASVAIKWFVREPLREEARKLLNGGEDLHAPDLLVAELANVAWKKAIRNEITEEHARHIARACTKGIPFLHQSASVVDRATQLAFALKISVCDCIYVACAEWIGGVLVTADERFVLAARAAAPALSLRLLGEPASPVH